MNGPITFGELAAMPLERLHGVGVKVVERLGLLGVHNVLDLLTYFPRRYVDRTNQSDVATLTPGDEAMVLATVHSMTTRRLRGGRTMVSGTVGDGSGRLGITFFNQGWRERQLPPGTEAIFFGRVEDFRGRLQMTNPVVDLVGNRTGRILAVYPQSEKARLTSWDIGALVEQVVHRCAPRGLADPVPSEVLERFGLVTRHDALTWIHLPDRMSRTVEARRRLVFDELLRLQVALIARKRRIESTSRGIAHGGDGSLVEQYLEGLSFGLTGAQRRVIDEIRGDLARPSPMHRLLQGDVGAGKTIVAVATMLTAVEGGYQAALMAPTEVLAEQHAAAMLESLAPLEVRGSGATLFDERPLRTALLTNRVPAARRRAILRDLADGEIDLIVGTHSLLGESVEFSRLGVVVIDEQHRFGVEQRAALRDRNGETTPDVLVMTATPIPRTAAMTVYGDLDVSVIDELPEGRTPITTRWACTPAEVAEAWDLVRGELAAGHQCYVVCPLIGESPKLEVAAATATFDLLTRTELAGRRVGLLHGRMPGTEKDSTMEAFRRGDVEVLVATTVIEVGVDVANASVMVILDADRFGIAQLHQLRGRVGRGSVESHCVLIAEEPSTDGRRRLEALVATTDGFVLAETDLDLRGEGTILGGRQKGRTDLRLASLRRDREWVGRAREVASALVGSDGRLDRHQALADELDVVLVGLDDDDSFLFKG
ncbi:MAG: ATP-dependent DNA helicase RecG [Microthrixaceae bacterium]